MAAFVRLYRQKRDSPRETTESFEGRTVLITGATSGLGLAAAQKLAVLNASRLIITGRTVEKGETAKRQIEQYVENHHRQLGVTSTRAVCSTDIIVLTLDMTTQAGVRSFVTELKQHVRSTSSPSQARLDAAVLNAGVTQKAYKQSPDGYEETIQVNTISTALLALLVLPLLKASSSSSARSEGGPGSQARQQQQQYTPHLLFVSSGTILGLKKSSMEPFLSSPKPIKALSEQANFPTTSRGGMKQYARSKLCIEHIMRRMAMVPSVASADVENHAGNDRDHTDLDPRPAGTTRPQVIISSTCPGLCATSLGRQYTDTPDRWLMTRLLIRVFMYVFTTFFARTAHQGANSYISALALGKHDGAHGQLWKNDKVWRGKELGEMVGDGVADADRERTADGNDADNQELCRFGDAVWAEVLEIIGMDGKW